MPLCALALGACSVSPRPAGDARPLLQLPGATAPADTRPAPAPDGDTLARGAAIAALAEQMIGVPYRWGGRTPEGFDCSGLVYYAHGRAGVRVPRTSRDQYRAALQVPVTEARPGDLLFFRSRNLSHVAIYLGDGAFVHAPSSGRLVTRDGLDSPYYRARLVAVGRLHGR